jgi:hypothetical protein
LSFAKTSFYQSFAKTRSPLVLIIWEMGCNVVELDYMRSRRGILESDDILAKEKHLCAARLRPGRDGFLFAPRAGHRHPTPVHADIDSVLIENLSYLDHVTCGNLRIVF